MPETAIRVIDPSILPWCKQFAAEHGITFDEVVLRALFQFRNQYTPGMLKEPEVRQMATATPPMVPTYNEDLF